MTDLSVYLVLDLAVCRRAGRDPADVARAAVLGGAGVVQVRDKDAGGRELLAVVRAVADAVTAARAGGSPRGPGDPDGPHADGGPDGDGAARSVRPGATVVVNDRVDVFLAARAAGADVGGVHVGQDDLPVRLVREIVGPEALVGVSAASVERLSAALADGADYVGIGPVRGTTTKHDARAALGHDGWARLAAHSRLPAVAIGGITEDDAGPLRRAGAAGLAVASAITAAGDPLAATARITGAWVRAGLDAPDPTAPGPTSPGPTAGGTR